MGRPKGEIQTETIGTRLPMDTLEELRKYAEERGTSRSAIVARAIEEYIHSKECIMCGAINNGDGKICSVCGSKLFSDDQIKAGIASMMFVLANDNKKEYDEMPGLVAQMRKWVRGKPGGFDKYMKLGLQPQPEEIIDRRGEKTTYYSYFHFVADGVDLVQNGETDTIMFPNEMVYEWTVKYFELLEEKEKKNKKSE